jgi:hypothetical protein
MRSISSEDCIFHLSVVMLFINLKALSAYTSNNLTATIVIFSQVSVIVLKICSGLEISFDQ